MTEIPLSEKIEEARQKLKSAWEMKEKSLGKMSAEYFNHHWHMRKAELNILLMKKHQIAYSE